MNWNSGQLSAFDWFAKGSGHLVIRARAGTGKTTTILEGINRAPEQRILLAAFNRRIAKELEDRIRNPRAEAKTLHSLGFGMVRRFWEGIQLTKPAKRRADDLALKIAGSTAPDAILRLVAKLCTLGREIAPLATTSGELSRLAWAHDCIPDPEWEEYGYDERVVCRLAHDAMQIASLRPQGGIDFADMLFLPLRHGWTRPVYDLVVVDEAQDMNPAQLELCRRVCKGRICVVGDDRQGIYGFRGADSGALDRLKTELKAEELGLSTTYRCGQTIVEAARTLVSDFTAAEANPEGEVVHLAGHKLLETARPGDAVLSRTNAPLITQCLAALRRGISARIEGRDIAASLRALVRQLAKGRAKSSIREFLRRLNRWEDRQIQRVGAGDEAEERIQQIRDRANTLANLAEGASGVPELYSRLETLFADIDSSRCIVFSTVHKAKGLEWDRVFVLESTFKRSSPEESNVKYVALTRARTSLYLVA